MLHSGAGIVESEQQPVWVFMVVEGMDLGRFIQLGETPVTVGRGPEDGFVLDDAAVTNRQLLIEWDKPSARHVLVKTGDSSTAINTIPIARNARSRHVLSEGDCVRIGRTVLRYSRQPACEIAKEAFGCKVCWPTDLEAAYLANRRLNCVADLIDESHFRVAIRVCEKCGQKFLSVFTETIDWLDGEDPQCLTLFPIEEREATELISRGNSITEEAINALGRRRKYLKHDHPKGEPSRTSWGSAFFVGPHD